MSRYAFDIETNGLLPGVDTLHSLVLQDLDTGDIFSFADHGGYAPTRNGLALLREATYVTGHNILAYDLPVLKHLYPWFSLREDCVVRDTMVMAKMVWPVDKLKDLDFPRWRSGSLPGQMIGAHRLEAWGYRLGKMKGEYSKDVKDLSEEYASHGDHTQLPEWARPLVAVDSKGRPALDPWKAWNRPMQDYCETDVEVTVSLWRLIQSHLDGTGKAAGGVGWSERSVELEHRTWTHIRQQEARGYGFDKEEAIRLAAELKSRQRALEEVLVEKFGSWWQPQDDPKTGTTPARAYSEKLTQFPDIRVDRISEKTGKPLKPYVGPPLCHYSPDAPFVRIQRITFNPKSRQHLGDRLQALYGWVPTEFGGKNNDQAKVDETTLKAIPESVLPRGLRETILEFLVVSKTLGQLADGKKSWIDLCADDGRLHGRMDTLGTVSHRGAHMDPNLGQVPAVRMEKTDGGEVPIHGWKGGFGPEARSLFRPGVLGWWQTGVDTSGLELRLLGHYLSPYDGGAFSERVSTPGLDIHAENAKVTGLSRADTKTVTYAFLYGAGPLKIGLGVGVPEDLIEELGTSPAARNYVAFLKKVQRNKFIQPDIPTLAHVVKGQQVQKAFLEGIAGLKDFKKDITDIAKAQGYIVALDGRKLYIRKAHAAINQLLQGGGAIVSKEWMLRLDEVLRLQFGMVYGEDYAQMAFVHDELQFEHRTEEMGQTIQEASSKAIEWVAQSLDFRGQLATDGKSGRTWKDCH